MSLTLIGQKKGMAQIFDSEGKLVVCTVILAEPNTVLHIKRKETHGYNSLALAGRPLSESKGRRLHKPLKGQFAKAQVDPCFVVHESRIENVDEFQVGQKIDASLFSNVAFVDIEGVTKGKGFQGVMKLHNMAGGPAAHGSGFHRHAGSTGMRSTPGRCHPSGSRHQDRARGQPRGLRTGCGRCPRPHIFTRDGSHGSTIRSNGAHVQ